MDYFEIKPNSEFQESKGETEEPKSFNILSDKKNDFLITLEKNKDPLYLDEKKIYFQKTHFKKI